MTSVEWQSVCWQESRQFESSRIFSICQVMEKRQLKVKQASNSLGKFNHSVNFAVT